MATTTNYSWTTPDDTALVKDGAAAIRSLGTAIDSTVFTNAGNAIAKTIVDAKGDIIAATAADTVSRLAVGANDTVLTADSSTATGLKWAAPAAGGMKLISTTSLSGASVTLSSIPSTYNHLQLVIQNFRPADFDAGLFLRFNADSTANRHFDATALTGSGAFGATSCRITRGTSESVASTGLSVINIWNYANTATWKFFSAHSVGKGSGTPTDASYFLIQSGIYNQTSAISSLLLLANSGNITSGTALLYGVK